MKVGISGANGKMGRLTADAVFGADDLDLHALYAPGHDGVEIHGALCSSDMADLAGSDVIVEFTNPDVVDANVRAWRDLGANVLVGTSGFTSERIDQLRADWGEGPQACLVVPNFAVSAVLMMRFAELASPHFDSAEIVEMHHRTKPDAPSGTALQTAARMAAARGSGHDSRHGRGKELARGALGADIEGVPVHSIRLEGSVAHQEVVLGSVGQYLTIRQDTTDYAAFAPGILLALRAIGELTGVTVGLEALLGV